jgi:hypothetical protein
MPTPNIRAGIWTRRVPWMQNNQQYWRTDIPSAVLFDSSVRTARYILKDGPIVDVPVSALRVILANAPRRHGGNTVGPYNINPFARTIDDTAVQISFPPLADLDLRDVAPLHKVSSPHVRPVRPPASRSHFDSARELPGRVRSHKATFDGFVGRIEKRNPSVRVYRNSDGTVSLEEIAYVLSVDGLRYPATTLFDELSPDEKMAVPATATRKSPFAALLGWLNWVRSIVRRFLFR